MSQLQNAPTVNGVMQLEESKIVEIRDELRLIQEGFEPSLEFATCTIHYVVATYNDMNQGKEINGDTASFVLGYMTEEEMKEMEQSLESPVAE